MKHIDYKKLIVTGLVIGLSLSIYPTKVHAEDLVLSDSNIDSYQVVKSGDYVYFKNSCGADISWTNFYENGNAEFAGKSLINKQKAGVYNNGRGQAAVYYRYNPNTKTLSTTTMALSKWKFVDVAPFSNNWKYAPVKFASSKKYMNGTAQNAFSPDTETTRAMFATIIYNMAGTPNAGFIKTYSDVDAGKWYSLPISWSCMSGIIDASKDKFEPEKSITREESMTMLYNYAKMKGKDLTVEYDCSGFEDANSVSNWALPYVKWALAHHIIAGKKIDGKLYIDAKGYTTRAESAQMLKNYIDNIK